MVFSGRANGTDVEPVTPGGSARSPGWKPARSIAWTRRLRESAPDVFRPLLGLLLELRELAPRALYVGIDLYEDGVCDSFGHLCVPR